ncbi:MAG TPA: universal stress protein [Vicinamibacterales bacterium]|jgi:hypothetical protein
MQQLIERSSQTPDVAGPSSSGREACHLEFGDVYVIFTSPEDTLRAVRVARRLARAMTRGVTLVHFRSVDFGAPLEEPSGLSPVQMEDFKARLKADGGDTRVRVCLCRDPRQAIPSVLSAHSLIVIGGRHRWWSTRSDRWRRTLEALGYVVVFVND